MAGIVLCDIDNCISDDRWRIPFIDPNEPDNFLRYHKYHVRSPADRAIPDRAPELRSGRVVFVTSRPEQYRAATAEWIARNGFSPRAICLLMRGERDHRPTPVVKVGLVREWLWVSRTPVSRISIALDDREDILAEYARAFGIPTRRAYIHEDSYHGPEDTLLPALP